MGLYGYSEGDYWSAVKETTGVNNPHQQGWGDLFLDILDQYHLPNFAEIQGHRFLTPILAHGGIPEKSLDDFFQYVLQPWLKKPELTGLTGKEYAPKAIEHLDSYPMVDKPIRRYLEYGQEAAWDFLDHAMQMARAYQQNGELPAPVEVGLAPYVLRGYRQFLEKAPVSGSGKRLRSPQLLLEPNRPGFSLYLPPQPLEAASVGAGRFLWQIGLRLCGASAPSNPLTWQSEHVRARRQGYDVFTEGQLVPLDDPAHEIEVRFSREVDVAENPTGGELLRSWRLYMQPTADQQPLVVFRYPEGSAARWNQTLPAGKYWLLTPRSVTVQAEGGEFFEEGSAFFGPWEDWHLQAWDLEKAAAIHLVENGQECCPPISLRQSLDEPELTGGECLAIDCDPDHVPVYVGLPPALRIPLRSGRAVGYELAHWQVAIASRWSAEPAVEYKGTLSDVACLPQKSNDYVDISLHGWLGNRPCGTYQVNLSGPGGLEGEFRFRVWPELLIEKLQRFYLPEAQGAVAAQFEMLVPADCSVQPQPGAETTQVIRNGAAFLVTVAPEATVAELQLVDAQGKQEPVRLPLSLAVPRLRWKLSLDGTGAQVEWQTSAVKLTVDALLQSHQPGLHLELALRGVQPLTVKLQLVDSAAGEMLMGGRRAITWQPGQERGYFALGEFSDTLRHYADLSNFEFRLEVWDPEQKTPTCITLVHLGRRLDIHYAMLNALEPPNFELVWGEPQPLRNRRVRIASLWQPWAETLELLIPDEARESLTITASLPPSHYKVHFFTASPWEKIDPTAMLPADSYLIETATPEQRLQWIRKRLQEDKSQAFAFHFEMACIYATKNAISDSAAEYTWCYQNLEKATLEMVMAFYNWLELRDPATQRATRIRMFRVELLKKFLSRLPTHNPLRKSYLEHFTETRLVAPESALFLLETENDPAIVYHCLYVLMERGEIEGMRKIRDRLNEGQLSDAEATTLCTRNPDLAFNYLVAEENDPICTRLINSLLQQGIQSEALITPGYFIRTSIRWSKIESILDAAGKVMQFCHRDRKDILIHAITYTDRELRIQLDLARGEMSIKDVDQLYICLNCHQYAAATIDAIVKVHNRNVHSGISPKFAPISSLIPISQELTYSAQPPEIVVAQDTIIDSNQDGSSSTEEPEEAAKQLPSSSQETKSVSPKKPVKRKKHREPRSAPINYSVGDSHFIMKGWYVRTPAGWGQIEEFVDPDRRKGVWQVVYLDSIELPHLVITLRKGTRFAEEVFVDLTKNLMRFNSGQEVYSCTVCRRFMVSKSILNEELIEIHSRSAKHDHHPSSFAPVDWGSCFWIDRTKLVFRRPSSPPDLLE